MWVQQKKNITPLFPEASAVDIRNTQKRTHHRGDSEKRIPRNILNNKEMSFKTLKCF